MWKTWVSCNLCGSRDLRFLFSAVRSGHQVVGCRHCGLMFYNPQPSPDQTAALYSADYFAQEFPEELAAEQIQLAHRRLARIEEEVGIGSLLDVGCGIGRFLFAARNRGWKAAGMDISPAAASIARRTSGAQVFVGDLALPPPNGIPRFDIVTLWDVFEHLLDPVGDLGRVRRWLRPGGLIVIQTQNANGVTYAWMRRRWEQFVPYHLYHFSSRTLRVALEQAGFQQIRIEASDRFPRDDPAAPGMPSTENRPQRDLRATLRTLRDTAFVWAGYDPFNIMVATARCQPEG